MNTLIREPADAATRTVRLPELLKMLQRGAPLAIFVMLVAGATAYLATQRMDPVYQATAGLLASRPPATFGNLDLITPPPVDPRVYQRVLLDGAVIRDALTRLEGRVRSELEMQRFIRDRIRVAVENQEISSVITISVRDSDPARAATYANAIANELIDWDSSRARRLVDDSIAALERAIADIDAQIAEAATAQQQALAASLRAQRVNQLETARARSASAVVVGLLEELAVAEPPALAIGPRLVFNTFVALVLGLIFGYGLQFARWSLDTRITTAEDLAVLARLPVLASFPRAARGRQRLPGEAVSFFRANILLATRRQRPAIIGITSPFTQGEKSGVAISLADGLARSGLRTLLIDADLRRPGTSYGLDLNRTQTPSLDAYLQNPGLAFEPITVSVDSKLSFDVLPSRAIARHPTELLDYGFGHLISRLRERYDAIVVDVPPVLAFADALAVAPACTGVVLCVSATETVRAHVPESLDLLQRNEIPLLGTALTSLSGGRSSRQPVQEVSVADRGSPPRERVLAQEPNPRPVARIRQR